MATVGPNTHVSVNFTVADAVGNPSDPDVVPPVVTVGDGNSPSFEAAVVRNGVGDYTADFTTPAFGTWLVGARASAAFSGTVAGYPAVVTPPAGGLPGEVWWATVASASPPPPPPPGTGPPTNILYTRWGTPAPQFAGADAKR